MLDISQKEAMQSHLLRVQAKLCCLRADLWLSQRDSLMLKRAGSPPDTRQTPHFPHLDHKRESSDQLSQVSSGVP